MQEIKGAKKFRHTGTKHALKIKYDRMYFNIVVTREYLWAPSSGVLCDVDCVESGINNANIDAIDFE